MQGALPSDDSSDLPQALRGLDPASRVNAAVALGALPLLHSVASAPLSDRWHPDRSSSLLRGAVKSVLKNFAAALFAIPGAVSSASALLLRDVVCAVFEGERELCDQVTFGEDPLEGPFRDCLAVARQRFPAEPLLLLRLLSALCEGARSTGSVLRFLARICPLVCVHEPPPPP